MEITIEYLSYVADIWSLEVGSAVISLKVGTLSLYFHLSRATYLSTMKGFF